MKAEQLWDQFRENEKTKGFGASAKILFENMCKETSMLLREQAPSAIASGLPPEEAILEAMKKVFHKQDMKWWKIYQLAEKQKGELVFRREGYKDIVKVAYTSIDFSKIFEDK